MKEGAANQELYHIHRLKIVYILYKLLKLLGRDNSSHNHPVGPLVWTYPRSISVFSFSENHMVLRGLSTKYYIQIYNLLL